jgi:anti-sigma-K factor RskA
MARNHNDRNTIRRYLLKDLSDDQQQAIEKRLLTEDDLLEELGIAEDELIDEYLAEKLSEEERERFEQNFLATPERRQKVQFSRSFSRYVRTIESQKAALPFWSHFSSTQNWALPATAAVAVIVIVAGIVWFSRQRTPSPPTFVTLTLTISTSNRAEGAPATKVTLPLNADALRLRLKLPETASPATRYRVELLREDGETQTLPIVGYDEQSVVVEIPAAQLSRRQYALNVYVIKPDGTEERIRGSYLLTVD